MNAELKDTMTWWEKFESEKEKINVYKPIFKAIKQADSERDEESLNKVIALVHKLDAVKYADAIEKFEKKIKILEKRLDRQVSDNLGSMLRHVRNQRKMSLASLADKTGISASYINRIELGERKAPSYPIIVQIAEALDISVSELLNIKEDEHEDSEPISIAKLILSNDVSYTDDSKMINKEEKENLLKIIQFIIKTPWKDKKHIEMVELMKEIDEFKEVQKEIRKR